MSGVERVKRITDLFAEGSELYMGDDDAGTPVLVWVNKLNSFEDDECRKDGMAARAERLMELADPDNAEMAEARRIAEALTVEELVEQIVKQGFDDDYLTALDDAEADKNGREKLEYLRRMGELLDDSEVPADDPRRERFSQETEAWYSAIRGYAQKRQDQRRADLQGEGKDKLVARFLETIRDNIAVTTFMSERRITEIYYSARDCQAVRDGEGWSHKPCDHSVRLLSSRADVMRLPEGVIAKIVEVLNQVTVDRRTAGNLDAPTTSSELSGQPNTEAASTPSTPVVTPPVAASI